MKTIITTAVSGFFARNFLRTDALRTLEAAEGVRLVVLVPKEKLEYYQQEFKSPILIFDELPDIKNTLAEKIFAFLDHSSIHTQTTLILHRTELMRQGSKLFLPMRFIIFCMRSCLRQLGRSKWWRMLVRWVYLSIPSSVFDKAFEKYEPDLVFCPTMVYGDHLILKEAKKRKIKTAGMVLSWDNLYSKSILRVHPDQLLVHTSVIAKDAENYGDYPRQNIVVVGLPQYDRYFKKLVIGKRDEFIKSLGGDPNKKLILYAFSGKAGLNIEFDIIDILHKIMISDNLKSEAQVLLRPYPRYDFPEKKLMELKEKYGFLIAPSARHISGSANDWEFDDKAIDLLTNSLAYADTVITMYSTFFIEGAIFDKPLIGVAFDGYKRLSYWNSARRFFEWDHLALIRDLNGIDFARSREDLIAAINQALMDPTRLQAGRRKIVAQQCEFMDGRSGERVARSLIELVR